MCWKQEWSHAINNLQRAIEHIEHARDKLIKRRERNDAALKKILTNPDRFEQKKIEARIEKNKQGQVQCEKIIALLQEDQDELFKMVHKYGISRDNPRTTDFKNVYKLMGNYPYAEKLKELSPEGSD
jgi:chromosome segregation ATPase